MTECSWISLAEVWLIINVKHVISTKRHVNQSLDTAN